MAAIDWKAMPTGIAAFDLIPNEVDWADPTHAPLMVSHSVMLIGNLSECALEDDEFHSGACAVAIDEMPNGKEAIITAVQEYVRNLAAAQGWSDYLTDPITGKYAWEPCGDGEP
jgi:hypothetical protein